MLFYIFELALIGFVGALIYVDYFNFRNTKPSNEDQRSNDKDEVSENYDTASLNSFDSSSSSSENSTQEYNILLLGETGCGKSTLINGIANYLRYSSFEEAASHEVIQLIPSNFVLPHPRTGKPILIKQQAINDPNELENSKTGETCTQKPQGHVFKFGDYGDSKRIRLIDTPGLGDIRGAELDRKSFDEILSYLNLHKQLHGIVIVVKNDGSRRDKSAFRYCISELLTHLHKSACQNIVFCFTNSRGADYGPGEGYATLASFLENDFQPTSNVSLELLKDNCFFLDNESLGYMIAQKQSYSQYFVEAQVSAYRRCWDRSVQQSTRMIEKLLSLEPHNLEHTSSLNNARKLILELAEPIVRLQSNINLNIEKLEAEEQRLRNSTQTKEELARSMHIEVDDLESNELDEPTTVCTSEKCIRILRFQGQEKVHYVTKCHVNCQLAGVETNRVGHPSLQRCAAMSCSTSCKAKVKDNSRIDNGCGCSWEKHMHLRCEYRVVKRTIIDANKQKVFNNTQDAIHDIQEGLRKLKSCIEEYQHEVSVIQDVSSKFAYILITNSNTPYNRFLEPYLNLLIDEEQKMLHAIPGYSRSAYDSLNRMRQIHQESVRILQNAIQTKSHENVCIEQIDQYRQQLFTLKHSGPQFSGMISAAQAIRAKEMRNYDRSAHVLQTQQRRLSYNQTTIHRRNNTIWSFLRPKTRRRASKGLITK